MKIMIKNIAVLVLMFLSVNKSEIFSQKKDVFIPNNSRQIIHGIVTDENGKPITAQIQIWHYPLTPVVENYGNEKLKGRTDNLISISFTTEKGFYSVRVPADTITIIITKGPEWSLVKKQFVIKEKTFNGIEFNVKLQRLYDLSKLGWYAGDEHHHSIFSDGYQTPTEIAQAMKSVGLSWGMLSDHNSDEGTKEWLSNKSKNFIPIHACEITTEPSDISKDNGYGHINQSFIEKIDGKEPENANIWARARFDDHSDVQIMIDKTHKQNGLLSINHPYTSWDWSGRFKSWGHVKSFDALEVWNGEPPYSKTLNTWDTNKVNITTWAIQSWISYLNAGNKISGIAGSDCHDIYGVNAYPKGEYYWTTTTGNPRTYLHMDKLSEKEIKKSLKNGNAFITSGFGPLLIISANKKNPGQTVKVLKEGKVNLEIKVLANQKLLHNKDAVKVIYNGTVIKNIATDSTLSLSYELPIEIKKDGWIIVEAFGQWPMYSITNPIYIDYPPYGDNINTNWKDPVDIEKWNKFLGHPEISMPDGPTTWENNLDSRNLK